MTGRDTREKLEEDVRQLAFDYAPTLDSSDEYALRAKVMKLLDRQAAITARECMERATSERVGWDCAECAEGLGKELDRRCDPLKARIAELEAERDELARAYKERGRTIAELREQLRNDNEPVCETVKRWLTDDAPEECIECEEGCWRKMHELMTRECDDCGPMHAAEREIRELKAFCERVEKAVGNGEELTLFGYDYIPVEMLEDEKTENRWAREFLNHIGPKCGKPDCPSLVAYVEQLEAERDELRKKYEKLLEYRTKVNCDCDCCNWQDERDRMQKVIETQAESFRKLEAELSSMVKKYEEQKRRLSDKQRENANQREELARFNAVRRRTKRIPKACVWPRKDDGKLLKPGRDCMSIKFYRDRYDVDYGDGEHLWCSFKVAREDERAWMRGED